MISVAATSATNSASPTPLRAIAERHRGRLPFDAVESIWRIISRVAGVAKVHKLSSNELPLGASPKAIEAFRASASDLALYPDGSAERSGDRRRRR